MSFFAGNYNSFFRSRRTCLAVIRLLKLQTHFTSSLAELLQCFVSVMYRLRIVLSWFCFILLDEKGSLRREREFVKQCMGSLKNASAAFDEVSNSMLK